MSKLDDKTWCYKQYWVQERSVGDIAKELDTYPNKVRRALKGHGIKLRDKASAQTVALKSGRSSHPTKDKGHSEEAKLKISESVAQSWENLSYEELEARRETAREQWANMSEEDRIKLRESAVPGIKRASKEGSKLEKYIRDKLTIEKYVIEYHKKGIVPNSNLEVDIYLPELGTAVEIDGPSHFLPIWGEDALRKTIKSDNEKNGLLRFHGIMVLRVAQKRKTLSQKSMRDTWNAIEKELKSISTKMPTKNNRFKEIEV
jgi:very-short-patch-repair endonuclease